MLQVRWGFSCNSWARPGIGVDGGWGAYYWGDTEQASARKDRPAPKEDCGQLMSPAHLWKATVGDDPCCIGNVEEKPELMQSAKAFHPRPSHSWEKAVLFFLSFFNFFVNLFGFLSVVFLPQAACCRETRRRAHSWSVESLRLSDLPKLLGLVPHQRGLCRRTRVVSWG